MNRGIWAIPILIVFYLYLYLYYKRQPAVVADREETIVHFNIEFYNDDEERSNLFEATPIKELSGIDIHDTKVQSSTRLALQKLKAWYHQVHGHPTKETALKEILKLIFRENTDISDDDLELAYCTFKTMSSVNGSLSETDLSETDVLYYTWCRILTDINADHRDKLKTALLEALARGSSKPGEPHCLTGRVTQVVQCLETLDKEGLVDIVTADTIKERIGYRFAALLKGYLETHPADKAVYESLDGNDTRVKKRIIKYITSELKKDYLETALLKEGEFNLFLKNYTIYI
jgi:hypothetical protein